MISLPVYLLAGAKEDLLQLQRYVSVNDSRQKADKLVEGLHRACFRLKTMPERGRIPPELERIGVSEFREIIVKPYRIVYQFLNSRVIIYCVLDGRRDLTDLLEERLLR